jgi:TonB family protein
MVTLEVSIDAEGNVVDARVISGPEELRRGALESVLQWHYAKNNSLPGRTQVTIDFRLPEPAGGPVAPGAEIGQPYPPLGQQTSGVLEHIELGGLPEPLRAAMRARLASFLDKPNSSALMRDVSEAARGLDQHVGITWRVDPVSKNSSLMLSLGEAGGPSPGLEQMESLLPAPTGPRIRVGGNAQAQKVVENKRPEYPALARQARIQGVVRFLALIGTDGRIRRLLLQSGHPLLVPSAQEAVQGWVYAPTLLNGNPVEVTTVIDVNYTLRE